MTKTVEDFFVYLVLFADFLFISLYFFFHKYTRANKNLTIILLYCVVNIVINAVLEFASINNPLLLYSFFTLSEFFLFSTFIMMSIINTSMKRVIVVTQILFSIFIVVYATYAKPRSIDSIPVGIETILILIFSFYYLYEQMSNVENQFIYNKYQFWIISGIMVYLAGSFFIYLFANQVDNKTLHQFWFLTNVFYILKNILFAIGILIYVKQQKNPAPENFQPYLN
jgi:hypothetical protein